MVTSDAEEHHLDNPDDECDEHGKGGDESHEDRPGTMIAGAAEAEKHCDPRETGSYMIVANEEISMDRYDVTDLMTYRWV